MAEQNVDMTHCISSVHVSELLTPICTPGCAHTECKKLCQWLFSCFHEWDHMSPAHEKSPYKVVGLPLAQACMSMIERLRQHLI